MAWGGKGELGKQSEDPSFLLIEAAMTIKGE
jgi:hypothetical protein